MTLTDLSQLEVTCDIAEADVGDIAGVAGRLTLNALTGKEFAVHVASVATSGPPRSGVVTTR